MCSTEPLYLGLFYKDQHYLLRKWLSPDLSNKTSCSRSSKPWLPTKTRLLVPWITQLVCTSPPVRVLFEIMNDFHCFQLKTDQSLLTAVKNTDFSIYVVFTNPWFQIFQQNVRDVQQTNYSIDLSQNVCSLALMIWERECLEYMFTNDHILDGGNNI